MDGNQEALERHPQLGLHLSIGGVESLVALYWTGTVWTDGTWNNTTGTFSGSTWEVGYTGDLAPVNFYLKHVPSGETQTSLYSSDTPFMLQFNQWSRTGTKKGIVRIYEDSECCYQQLTRPGGTAAYNLLLSINGVPTLILPWVGPPTYPGPDPAGMSWTNGTMVVQSICTNTNAAYNYPNSFLLGISGGAGGAYRSTRVQCTPELEITFVGTGAIGGVPIGETWVFTKTTGSGFALEDLPPAEGETMEIQAAAPQQLIKNVNVIPAVERFFLDRSGEAPAEMTLRIPLDGHYNASIIQYGGKFLLATRVGWTGSRLFVSELDAQFNVLNTVEVEFPPKYLHGGFDDPRLFTYRGKLHMSFAFIETREGITTATQYLTKLGDDYQPEKVWSPKYDKANAIEKNWIFFEHGDDLLAVYSISPHVILRVNGNVAEPYAETDTLLPWSGGYLRGGTPVVRIGDEYISFLHGSVEGAGRRTYNVGVYAFEAKPPFRVTRITHGPIAWANPATRPAHVPPNCIWPAGLVKLDNRWLVSCGVHDSWTELTIWNDAAIQNALIRV